MKHHFFPYDLGFRGLSLGLMVLLAQPSHAALITHFDFDGGSLTDNAGGVVASAVGGGTSTTGYSGDAWSFSGSNYLRAGVNVRQDNMPQMTWGAWVRSDSTTSVRQVLSIDDNTPGDFDRSIAIDHRGGGGVGWSAFRGPASGGQVVGSGSRPVTAGQWTFLAASYDETINEMRFYVDNMAAIVASTAFTSGHLFFDIGHNPDHGELFLGAIDEVFVFDEVLSAAQIENIRQNGVASAVTASEPGSFALVGVLAFLLARRRRGQSEA